MELLKRKEVLSSFRYHVRNFLLFDFGPVIASRSFLRRSACRDCLFGRFSERKPPAQRKRHCYCFVFAHCSNIISLIIIYYYPRPPSQETREQGHAATWLFSVWVLESEIRFPNVREFIQQDFKSFG